MLRLLLALVIALHGVIHITGFVTYVDLGEVEGLDATTLLVGRDDVPGVIAGVIGVFWLVTGTMLLIGAAGVAGRIQRSRNLVVLAAAISVVLAIMALPDAWASIPINGFIIVATWFLFVLVAYRRESVELRSAIQIQGNGTFNPAMVKELPVPVQRYFLHAIAPGTPLAGTAFLEQQGVLTKNGKEMRFTASQVLSPRRGFLWEAKTQGLVRVTARDYYFEDKAQTRVAIFNAIPVVNSSHENTVRSALGRLAIESVWVPSSLLPRYGVSWKAESETRLVATTSMGTERFDLNIEIDSTGRLLAVYCQRFGDPEGDGNWRSVPFGGRFSVEASFSGYTIPSEVQVGWNFGTPDYAEFFRATLTRVAFL